MGFDHADGVEGTHLGTMPLGEGDVVQVQGVLGPDVTPDVAVA